MCTCALQHFLLHKIKNFLNFGRKFFKGNDIFLSCITTADNSLSVLDILRSTFDTNRNSSHFLLCEFESRASVGVVYFDTDASCLECCKQFICFLKNAFFALLDRNDDCLSRSDSRRQDKSAVVTVNHDDRTDHTCCHTPGCLVYVFQCIVLVCVLNAECSGESVTEVVACTGLKCFTVMHQGLNCVGSYCTCEFFFVCLLTFDDRDSQNFFAEISVQVQHLDRSLLCFLCCCVCSMTFLP